MKQRIEEPTVNLTPLIDVVFVILIMFIVIAPLLELDRIELADAALKKSDSVTVQDASPIALHVRRDNGIWSREQLISLDRLAGHLREAKKQYPTARLQVFHDKQAHFGTYQSIKNAAEEAGFSSMDIVLKP